MQMIVFSYRPKCSRYSPSSALTYGPALSSSPSILMARPAEGQVGGAPRQCSYQAARSSTSWPARAAGLAQGTLAAATRQRGSTAAPQTPRPAEGSGLQRVGPMVAAPRRSGQPWVARPAQGRHSPAARLHRRWRRRWRRRWPHVLLALPVENSALPLMEEARANTRQHWHSSPARLASAIGCLLARRRGALGP